jgi:hypothetical protein
MRPTPRSNPPPAGRRKAAPGGVWKVLLWAAAFARSLAAASDAIPAAAARRLERPRARLPRRRTSEGRPLPALRSPLTRRPMPARVAVDCHQAAYYGTPPRDTTRGKDAARTPDFHTDATACAVGGPDRYAIGLIAVAHREPMTAVSTRLLGQVAAVRGPVQGGPLVRPGRPVPGRARRPGRGPDVAAPPGHPVRDRDHRRHRGGGREDPRGQDPANPLAALLNRGGGLTDRQSVAGRRRELGDARARLAEADLGLLDRLPGLADPDPVPGDQADGLLSRIATGREAEDAIDDAILAGVGVPAGVLRRPGRVGRVDGRGGPGRARPAWAGTSGSRPTRSPPRPGRRPGPGGTCRGWRRPSPRRRRTRPGRWRPRPRRPRSRTGTRWTS